jgi:hypothetical protein
MAKVLPEAMSFYSRGFRRIRESFDEDLTNKPEPVDFWRVGFEIVWAAVFWLITFAMITHLSLGIMRVAAPKWYYEAMIMSRHPKAVRISGKVLQKTKEGFLVTCNVKGGDAVTVFVVNYSGPRLVDDDPIEIYGEEIEPFTYTNRLNVSRTVRAYRHVE